MCMPKKQTPASPIPVNQDQTADKIVIPDEQKNNLSNKRRGTASLRIPRRKPSSVGLNVPT